eukprot:m.57190 g.57190  ORF g.57190 m.57190 type:complete len:132 (-) comp13056_c0_seq4:235-630(-)
MDKTSRMKECSAGTSASHLSPPALRLLFLLLLVFSACTRTAAQGSAGTKAAAVTCAQNTTVDPASITRIGSDYKWLAFSSSATIQDCINACCAEVECQVLLPVVYGPRSCIYSCETLGVCREVTRCDCTCV